MKKNKKMFLKGMEEENEGCLVRVRYRYEPSKLFDCISHLYEREEE